MTILVNVKNIKKNYGSKEAVKGISFEIKENEILGLLGPNGSGKTTTIGMMLGLLKPSWGEILIDGKNIENNSWNGECFVFDNRVSVNKHLKKGSYNLCFACRMPLSKSDMKNKSYLKGVSCPKCHGKKTITQLNKYKTRHNQFLKRGIK